MVDVVRKYYTRYLKIVGSLEDIRNMLMFPSTSTSDATSSFISHCPWRSRWSPPFCLLRQFVVHLPSIRHSLSHPRSGISFHPILRLCARVRRFMLCLSWHTHVRRRRRETVLMGSRQFSSVAGRHVMSTAVATDVPPLPASAPRPAAEDGSAMHYTAGYGRACIAVSREIECSALKCS